jgi:tetratricopeptide (TPR) repeat protein
VKNATSQCNPSPFYAGTGYPSYDPRCRKWFNLGYNGESGKAYFQYPRKSSSGDFVTTVTTPLRNATDFAGVLIFNVLAKKLSDSVNNLKILDNGYSYLIDAKNPASIILHPNAPSGCNRVDCSEGFSSDEYDDFYNHVLLPIQTNVNAGKIVSTVSKSYRKQGKLWRLDYSNVNYTTATYTLIVTVPQDDIDKSSNEVNDSIDSTVIVMIAVFSISITILAAIFFFMIITLIRVIVSPLDELRQLCIMVSNDDLSGTVPSNPSSYDMKILLEAFSNLMVALRFGSDSYARGDQHRAYEVFSDALALFTKSSNVAGIGASENNLASAEMSLGDLESARKHFLSAIQHAEKMIADLDVNKKPAERRKLERILSDRKGNIAILYLEQKNFAEAYKLLEAVLDEDKLKGYIRGCVVKQGILGHYYLKQGEIPDAERLFVSALNFVLRRDEMYYDIDWNDDEAGLSQQIAMYNMAYLRESVHRKSYTGDKTFPGDRNQSMQELSPSVVKDIENRYIEALVSPSHMHTQTATKIFQQLFQLFRLQNRSHDMKIIESICNDYHFLINEGGSSSGSSSAKRVVFCLDYSGSMSGGKIRSAVTNLAKIFKNHIYDYDSFMLIRFNHNATVDASLGLKSGRGSSVADAITRMTDPSGKIQGNVTCRNSNRISFAFSGGTAFFNALESAIEALKVNPTDNDWIIALTDGEDTSSRVNCGDIISILKSTSINLITIGVGSDVRTTELQSLAQATKKGMYFAASTDNSSITEAFGKVAAVIQGQVLLEDV